MFKNEINNNNNKNWCVGIGREHQEIRLYGLYSALHASLNKQPYRSKFQ